MSSKPLHIQTAVLESAPMSQASGRRIFLKMECDQPVKSFKIRGIGNLCQELVRAGKTRLVSSSGGNAGYAAAYAARHLGMPITVIVPQTTKKMAIERIAAEGATVKVHGAAWDEADQVARELSHDHQCGYISPFDHPAIWAGHSTMIDEVVDQCEKPEAVVVAVGGGGLLCGVLAGLHRHGWGDIPALAVETEGAASFAQSLAAGHLITLPAITTIATSLGAKRVADKLWDWTTHHTIIPTVVSDRDATEACTKFAHDHRILVEPACGAALSVAYNNIPELHNAKSVLIIVCGGIGTP